LDKSNSRVFAATAAVGQPLVLGFRLQRDTEPLYSARVAGIIEFYSRNANPRVIALRDKPREKV
jgi:hypothetical protein